MATSGPSCSSKHNPIHHYNQKTQMSAYFSGDEKRANARNHMADNRRQLKEMQEELRAKKIAASAPKPEEWKLSRFKGVRSKVAEVIHSSSSSRPSSNQTDVSSDSPHHEFLRRGTLNKRMADMSMEARSKISTPRSEVGGGPGGVMMSPMMSGRSSTAGNPFTSPRGSDVSFASSASPSSARKPAVPRSTDLAKLAPKSHKNHIVENRRSAVHLHPPNTTRQEDDGRPHLHKAYGEVPAYLQERKQEWAEAEARRRAAMPDPDCPPGMRLLTEKERVDTLQALDENEAEVRRLLTKIPLQVDTPSMTRRRDALDQRLDEINKNRTLFSKPKVFIIKEEGDVHHPLPSDD